MQDMKQQEKLDEEKKQVEAPKMTDDQEKPADKQEDAEEEGEGMEYQFDQEAEQMQGRLATDNLQQEEPDKVQDEADGKGGAEDDGADEQADDHGVDDQDSEMVDDDIQKTQEQLKAADQKAKDQKQKTKAAGEDGDDLDDLDAQAGVEEQADLVEDYQKFLENRKEQMLLEPVEEEKMEVDQQFGEEEPRGPPVLEDFDYQEEKLALRALHEAWREDDELCQKSIALLNRFKGETGSASSSLCEQLRIVLEPQLSQ